jgi:hypothetical protein
MDSYKLIDKLDLWKNRIIVASTIITLTLNFNEHYGFLKKYEWYTKNSINTIIGINAAFVACYIVIEIILTTTFQKAEGRRILRYIDNSFNTNFSAAAIPQTGYFSQDTLTPGIYKMCINCFENALFSYTITKRMATSRYIKAGIVFIVFIFTATIGDTGTVRYLTDAILPLSLIQEAIKFYLYTSRLENIYDGFASFFTNLNGQVSDFDRKHSEALKLLITYETTLAWSSIKLDSAIFGELNPSLSHEWELLKQQYNIN